MSSNIINDPGIGAAFYKTAVLLLTSFRIKIKSFQCPLKLILYG